MVKDTRVEYIKTVSELPDLTEAEATTVVDICVAHWQNNEGWGPSSVAGIANLVRSRRNNATR
jgi:hypothetical protein